MTNDNPTPPQVEDGKDYLLAESNIFNNRVIWYLEQQQKQEIFALGATGFLWAYLLKGDSELYSIYVALAPPLIVGVLYIKSIIMTKAMTESMDYLESLENNFNLKEGLGWIHFYKKNTSNYKRKWRNYFWKGLLLSNIVITIAFIYQNTLNKPDLIPNKVEIGETNIESKVVVKEPCLSSTKNK